MARHRGVAELEQCQQNSAALKFLDFLEPFVKICVFVFCTSNLFFPISSNKDTSLGLAHV